MAVFYRNFQHTVVNFRHSFQAHASLGRIFPAIARGSNIELEMRLRRSKVCGGLTKTGDGVRSDGTTVPGCTPLTAASIAGKSKCIAVIMAHCDDG